MSFLFDLLIPHHGNNHKARLLKSGSLFLLTFIFLLFQISLNFFTLTNPAVLGFSANISPEKIIELTNMERAKNNTESLKENKLLSEAARQKAADMFAFNYWAHISPSGRTPWTFFSDVGYKYQYAGENLARDFKDPDSVVKAWMNSPSHRENVVNPKYQEIGIAVVDGTLLGIETTLVVQLFGTPYGAVAVKPQKQKTVIESVAQLRIKSPPVAASLPKSKQVLTKGFETKTPVSSPFDLTRVMVIVVAGVLIAVFAVDILLISYRDTPRLSGKSLAQMMFLIAVLVASFLIKQGAIL